MLAPQPRSRAGSYSQSVSHRGGALRSQYEFGLDKLLQLGLFLGRERNAVVASFTPAIHQYSQPLNLLSAKESIRLAPTRFDLLAGTLNELVELAGACVARNLLVPRLCLVFLKPSSELGQVFRREADDRFFDLLYAHHLNSPMAPSTLIRLAVVRA